MDSVSDTFALDVLRSRLAAMHRRHPGTMHSRPLSFGVPAIDNRLPAGGLSLGALHEFQDGRIDDCAATLLMAGLLAQTRGTVLWIMPRRDLFAPALAGVGLRPSRLIHAEAGHDVLLIVEEVLRHPGLAGVVGELHGRMTTTASRRLQLAAEASGTLAFIHRRTLGSAAQQKSNAASVALTRWRITSMPSRRPVGEAPEIPGLARARWYLELVRCRGGEPFSWMVEACDAQGCLSLVSDAVDRPATSRHIRHAT